MTKDFEGTDLAIGDSVAYIDTGGKQLKRGIVKGFTAKSVAVEYDVPGYRNWNGDFISASKRTITRFTEYVVKVGAK